MTSRLLTSSFHLAFAPVSLFPTAPIAVTPFLVQAESLDHAIQTSDHDDPLPRKPSIRSLILTPPASLQETAILPLKNSTAYTPTKDQTLLYHTLPYPTLTFCTPNWLDDKTSEYASQTWKMRFQGLIRVMSNPQRLLEDSHLVGPSHIGELSMDYGRRR